MKLQIGRVMLQNQPHVAENVAEVCPVATTPVHEIVTKYEMLLTPLWPGATVGNVSWSVSWREALPVPTPAPCPATLPPASLAPM